MKMKLSFLLAILLSTACAPLSVCAQDKDEVLPMIVMDNAPLPDAISNLARQAGIKNLIIDPKITAGHPPVKLRLENVTAKQALQAVLQNHNLQLSEDAATKTTKVISGKTVEAAKSPSPEMFFQPIGTAIVKNQNVNVRGQPSFIGEVITKLKKGETVTLLEEIKLKKPKKDQPTNWFRIALPTNTPVWVHTDFVDPTNQTIRPKRLNVRAGPGENYSIVARMGKGGTIKQIRKVNDWIEIEAPTNAFAFVAAEFLEKEKIAPSAPPPTEIAEPAPEVVTVPPGEEVKPAVEAPETPAEAKPAPDPASEPVVITPAEPVPAEPAAEPLPKRAVTREGNVRLSRNIQSPTYFELENLDGKLINYLHSPEEQKEDPTTKKMQKVPKFNFKAFEGRTVIVTGTESIDKRWKRTPVLEVETIEEEK